MAEYDGPIVDAHHHLWRYEASRYPWLKGRSLARDFTEHDYARAFPEHHIAGTVWIEALAGNPEKEMAEAEAVRQATAGRVCTALIGHVPLDTADVEARLDRFMAISPAFRGVRDILSPPHCRAPDTLEQPSFVAGLRALAARNLIFDAMLSPTQMAGAAEAFSQVPDLKVAIEHVGNPHDRSAEGLRIWQDGLHLLSKIPGCIIKVSALQCLEPDWSDASLGRILDPAVRYFGPDRMCLGSDWPVHDETCPGSEALRTFQRLTASWSHDEQTALFYGVARTFYRI